MYYYPNGAGASYMQNQTQPMMQQTPQLGLKGRPVSSLEEVRAAQIDFDGSLYVFPDLAHNRIYTKAINIDGTASLNMYELSQIPNADTQKIDMDNFITREEFDNAVGQIKEALTQVNVAKDGKPQFNF